MERTTLEKFFAQKRFRIPPYQRDFAWQVGNVDDLWDDIKDALDSRTSHYLGTFILAKGNADGDYNLVDGQQRLTTITMLLHALIARLPERDKIVASDRYLQDRAGQRRLTLQIENDTFFKDLTEGKSVTPINGGQRRLHAAFVRINEFVGQIPLEGEDGPLRWTEEIGKLNVLEFVEDSEGDAIRIFATVNDRGKPLTTTEKIKSFLIYESNRYLGSSLDAALQQRFGSIFQHFDRVKESSRLIGVDLMTPDRFTEDSVVRYHFLSYPETGNFWAYDMAEEGVLDQFLKPWTKDYAAKHALPAESEGLSHFVDSYSKDLTFFFETLRSLLILGEGNPRYYKLLASLQLSTHLYPLTVKLAERGLLDQPLPTDPTRTFLDAVETVDLRVYKTRGTNPRKEMATLAQEAGSLSPQEISDQLRDFTVGFMDDAKFASSLRGPVYNENEGLGRILLEWEEFNRDKSKDPDLSLENWLLSRVTRSGLSMKDLQGFRADIPTVDHILAQTPTFKGRGFADDQQFHERMHCLGNLTLVEKSINSAAQNKTPEQKASEPKLYSSSAYSSTRRLGALIHQWSTSGKLFDSQALEERTGLLTNFVSLRWPIWT